MENKFLIDRVDSCQVRRACAGMELVDFGSQRNATEVTAFAIDFGAATLDPHSGNLKVDTGKRELANVVCAYMEQSFTFDLECVPSQRKYTEFYMRTIENGYGELHSLRRFDVVHEIRVTGAEPQSQALLSSRMGVICGGTVDSHGCCRLNCRILVFLAPLSEIFVTVKGPKLRIGMTGTLINKSVRDKYEHDPNYNDVCVCNERVYTHIYRGGMYCTQKTPVPAWLRTRELTGRTNF